jgi:hypothetical protein
MAGCRFNVIDLFGNHNGHCCLEELVKTGLELGDRKGMKVHLIMLSDFRKRAYVLLGLQDSPICPPGKRKFRFSISEMVLTAEAEVPSKNSSS